MTASTPPDIHHQWLDHLHRQGKSRHTLQAYQRGLEHFARWYVVTYGEAFTADTVMPRDVRDWKAYQQTLEKAAPATINQRLVALTRFFRWARTQGLCRDNPVEDIGTIRLTPRQPQAMEHTVVRKLLRAARGHVRDYALLELLAGTGLRIGELLALTIGDVELNDRSGKVIVRRGKHGLFRHFGDSSTASRELCCTHALSEQIHLRSAVHLALQHLQAVDVALGRAV